MYHLTCPSCQYVTDSPFVRSGAVVRCTACESKYRIKSSHFERELHTGPRTLDETDSVLRSDSVDIDPDEVSPVSIDDDGNVVGLSGLSELMRWSDAKGESQAPVTPTIPTEPIEAKHQRRRASDAELPTAKRVNPKGDEDLPSTGRARAQTLNRKKRNQTFMMIGGTVLAVIVLALIIAQLLPGGQGGPTDVASGDGQPNAGITPPGTKPGPGNKPGTNPDNNSYNAQTNTDTNQTPVAGPNGSTSPEDVALFPTPGKPSPNPDSQFVAPWEQTDDTVPPTDVPTVLTPAKPMSHEGWYITNPPRGTADAVGVSNVELGELTATVIDQGNTLLVGSVSNNTSRAVMRGELHVMLLDSTGNVFAETYTPLVMIEPNAKQGIALPIATRYWQRSRGVRSGVLVSDWADAISPMQSVQLDPIGQGESAALRVSVKHRGDKPLRSVMILLSAIDDADNTVCRYFVEESNLYILSDQWLDLVIATPLPKSPAVAKWSALVQPR